MKTGVGVSVVAIKNCRGYRAQRLARGASSPQKRLGVILRKGLLGVNRLAKKGLPILFQIRVRERTGAARMPKPKNLGRYREKGSGSIVFDL